MSEAINADDVEQTQTSAVTIHGGLRETVANILSDYSENDTTSMLRFVDTRGDLTTYRENATYTEGAIMLCGRVEYPNVIDGDMVTDERVILESPFEAKDLMNDAWDVAYAKYNGEHWHIEAEHTIEFIAFALSRGFEVVARPSVLADKDTSAYPRL